LERKLNDGWLVSSLVPFVMEFGIKANNDWVK
jgi:hypothetical protein